MHARNLTYEFVEERKTLLSAWDDVHHNEYESVDEHENAHGYYELERRMPAASRITHAQIVSVMHPLETRC